MTSIPPVVTIDSSGRVIKTRPGKGSLLTPIMLAAAGLQSLLMILLALRQHRSFGTFGYDAGIYDQATWLIGQHGLRSTTFLSTRGLPLWGHHVNPILIVFAPLSRLGAGVLVLTAIQTVALALGSLPLAWLARSRTGSTNAGLLIGAAYLLYPPNLWLNYSFFHPEVLCVPLLLLAVWFGHQRSHRWMWIAMFGALMCREEVSLVVAAFGAVFAFRAFRIRNRVRVAHGLALVIVAACWFVVCTEVIIPNSLGSQPFYVSTFFGKYGSSYSEILQNLAGHPSLLGGLFTEGHNEQFLFDLFGPFGLLALVGLPVTMSLAPLFGLLMSSNPDAHSIQSHYPALLIPGIVVASTETFSRLWNRPRARAFAALLVVASSLSMAYLRAPLPGTPSGVAWKRSDESTVTLNRALKLIPKGASVSAQTNLVPHLSHRQAIYQFPNPFDRWFYGQFALEDPAGLRAPSAEYPSSVEFQSSVDWIIVKPSETGRFRKVLNRLLTSGEFETVFDEQDVLVARRVGNT